MTRGVRRDARNFYEGKRGGHSVTTTEALDRLTGTTATNSTAEALDRHHDTTPETFGPHHDTAPEALDRLRSRDSLRAAPFGRRACFVVLPVPGLALRFRQDRDRASVLPNRLPHPRFTRVRSSLAMMAARRSGGARGGRPATRRPISPPPGGLKGRGARGGVAATLEAVGAADRPVAPEGSR